MKCSSGLLYQVFYEQAEIKLRERKGAHWPTRIGIDEHFFTRRNGYSEFATVFTNLSKGRLFEVAHGRSKKDLLQQVKDIPGRENVRLVAIDLSRGYRSLIKELFPNAQIVADKFHVLRLPSHYIIKEKTKIHGHRQELRLRRLLLKNRSSLEYDVRCELDSYLTNHGKLNELYRAKEKLHQLYRIKGLKRAERAMDKLIASLKESSLEELNRLSRTIRTWKNEILFYFEQRVTNALSEAINSSAKTLQKRACGYKSFKNYRLSLLSACAF
jgi:transposase